MKCVTRSPKYLILVVCYTEKMGTHKERSVLNKELNSAKAKVTVGASYRHYKDPSKLYKVIDFGFLESNDELHVIYQAQYGESVIFLRPLTSWLEQVEWEGQTLLRFMKI